MRIEAKCLRIPINRQESKKEEKVVTILSQATFFLFSKISSTHQKLRGQIGASRRVVSRTIPQQYLSAIIEVSWRFGNKPNCTYFPSYFTICDIVENNGVLRCTPFCLRKVVFDTIQNIILLLLVYLILRALGSLPRGTDLAKVFYLLVCRFSLLRDN